jgi:steroid 5-alpha reductase family enzyme
MILGVGLLLIAIWQQNHVLWTVAAVVLLVGLLISLRGALGRRTFGRRSWW